MKTAIIPKISLTHLYFKYLNNEIEGLPLKFKDIPNGSIFLFLKQDNLNLPSPHSPSVLYTKIECDCGKGYIVNEMSGEVLILNDESRPYLNNALVQLAEV